KTFYPEENQPEVFPVPATDAVYIRWKKTPAQSSPYQIFNSDGRLVQSGRLGQDGQETLEIGSFPAGVYLLWIKTETGAVMYRLVKI
ncbi:MAG: T9SS type A sorting domain-containing protein, partial [Thermoanaerobaculia bacterium]|nr:T9SS type A sorting domain-containing protein [Thermoanaerobaculia bacterium]